MDEILFLAHRIPYPPDKGDKIRSYNVLRYLSERAVVHLGCFVDDADDWSHVSTLRTLCQECHFVPLPGARIALRAAGGFFGGKPLSVASYDDKSMRRWVQSLLEQRPVGCVYLFSSAMAQFVNEAGPSGRRTIMDFVDVDSDKWRLRAKRAALPKRWLYAREAKTLLAHDRVAAKRFDASVFVSESEAELFRTLAPESAEKVHAITNGLDAGYFSPQQEFADPFDERSSLVFCGAMDYWPNEDAVIWFANEVHSILRQRFPALEFSIVGRNPTRRVLELGRRDGVTVTGAVPDVRPYLANAAAIVVPLRDSPGIANKVLEGMAMARAVVATPEAVTGLKIEDGKDVLVAKDGRQFVDAVANILEGNIDDGSLCSAARNRIIDDYSWPAALSPLQGLIAGH